MQGLLLLNFQSKDAKKSASELAKVTGSTTKEIQKQLENLVKIGILVPNSNKFMINEHFNSENKQKVISLKQNASEREIQDSQAIQNLNLGSLSEQQNG